MRVADLTKGKVETVVKQLKVGMTKKTVRNHLTSLSLMCEYAISMECRTTNQPKVTPKGEKESRAATKLKRFYRLLRLSKRRGTYWKLAFRFACMTGLRQGEQRALTWGQVDLDNQKSTLLRR